MRLRRHMPARLSWSAALYDALASGFAMAAIGLVATAARQPWLFPSLGPTIFLQTVTPHDRSSSAWSVLAGHSVGVGAGYLAVFLCGAQMSPEGLFAAGPTHARILATALAISGTMAGQRALRALHAPAAATTMLIALGNFPPTWGALGALAAGILLVCAIGEAARRLRRKFGDRLGWPEQ